MVTYDDYIQTCQDLTDDSTTATRSFIVRVGQTGYRRAMKMFGQSFEERTQNTDTVAGQQYYQLPIDYSFTKTVTVLVGTQQYPLEQVTSQEQWDQLNRLTNIQNNRPTRFFVRLNIGIAGEEIGLWPTPSSSGNTFTLVYEAIPRTLGTLKYTTGQVTVTTNSLTVTGTSTAFTPAMVGRYLQVFDELGDTMFYRISAYQSPTELTLQNFYEGTTLTTANYQICELFSLPEEAQMIPVYYTAWHYYLMRQNTEKVTLYKNLHDMEFKEAKRNNSSKVHGGVIKRGTMGNLGTPYPLWFPTNIT